EQLELEGLTFRKAALGRHQQEAGIGLGRDDPMFPRFQRLRRRGADTAMDLPLRSSILSIPALTMMRDRRRLWARSLSLWHRAKPSDHRGVLPLRPRPRRDPPADDRRRSLPARGAGDGEGVNFEA